MASEELMSVVQLTTVARVYPAGALPAGTHQSYPIPLPDPKGLRMAFFFCRAEIVTPRAGLQLWPPSYVAFLNARTGKFQELRAVTPKEYGQRHAEDKPMGPYLTLPERMAPEFLTAQVRWCQAYDEIIPAFLAGLVKPAPEVRQSVAEFRALFPQVTEPPLLPYYQALGKEFFGWLNRVEG